MLRYLLTGVLAAALTAALLAFTPDAHLLAGKPRGSAGERVLIAKRNLAHSRGACLAYRRADRSLASTRSHCRSVAWLERVLERHRPLSFREYVRRHHPCLYPIFDRETGGTWSPTIDYGFGHGNVFEAYGIPQANPGYKMASAGPDWRTNPYTQLRWAVGYAVGRYGSECGALAHHNANGVW